MTEDTALPGVGKAADPAVALLSGGLPEAGGDLSACRAALQAATDNLGERFLAGEPVTELVMLRASIVDRLLSWLWRRHAAVLADDVALIAVGGYGRGELHPCSDVDIMLLCGETPQPAGEAALSAFVTSLWDVGLEIGHSVRTVAQCRQQAEADITVTTTLMEARLLRGPAGLFDALQEAISPKNLWPSTEFFAAKRKEQLARHHRYDDTAYKLEPNVKGSPGGLRDIQMIGWVAKRHFGVKSLDELVAHGFLTPGQLRVLHDGQTFLWRVRFGFHTLTARREHRQ
jgi:[protein-PII] uridylyltransferase